MKHSEIFKALVIAAAAALLAAPAHADAKRSRQYDKCMDKVDLGAMKNSQWASCAAEEGKRQDVTLNTEYKQLRESLEPEQRDALLKAQRSWLKFREDWCRFEEVGPGAPGGAASYQFCLLEVTDKQIEALKSLK